MEFKDKLQLSLDMRNMKPIDLAVALDVSKASVSQYLHGNAIPTNDNVYKIARILRVNFLWLLGYSDDMENKVKTNLDYMELTESEINIIEHLRKADNTKYEMIKRILEME